MVAQLQKYEPLFDLHPRTGVSFEVFYSDRTLETFGRRGAGWFWWPRQRGCAPAGTPTGPFATDYAAYRHAMTTGGRSFGDDAQRSTRTCRQADQGGQYQTE
jgi:hypothetical protein